jgi:hypothetical protein
MLMLGLIDANCKAKLDFKTFLFVRFWVRWGLQDNSEGRGQGQVSGNHLDREGQEVLRRPEGKASPRKEDVGKEQEEEF